MLIIAQNLNKYIRAQHRTWTEQAARFQNRKIYIIFLKIKRFVAILATVY